MRDPGGVLRAVGLALLLTGCDQALGLEREVPPAVCGPFAEPVALVFDPQLGEPHDVSVDGTGLRGMVNARRTNAQMVTWTGPHAITRDAFGVWVPDDVRDRPNLDTLDGAHVVTTLAAGPRAIGWIEKPRTPAIFEYEFQGTAWSMVPAFVDPFIAESTRAGNLIEVAFGGASLKWAVLIEIAQVAGERNNLRINQLAPGGSWQLTSQATPIETDPLKINPNGGVLTADHNKLVYAAKVGNAAHSELFASPRIGDKFAHGPELRIEGVDSDADLTEPWINGDCRVLYFRRDGATWMATAVDDPGAGP